MMTDTDAIQQFQELLAACRRHLLDEYPKGHWVMTDPDTHAYFRALAKHSPPPVKQNAPSPVAPAPIAKPAPPPPPKREEPSPPPPPPKQELPAPPPPKPAPPPKTETVASEEWTLITPTLQPIDLAEVRQLLAKVAPGIRIHDPPPDDSCARAQTKQKAQVPDVVILAFNEPPAHRRFLENLARAIDNCLGSVRVLESDRLTPQSIAKMAESPHVRLVIASGRGFHNHQALMQHYREAQDNQHWIGQQPLCLLSDISLYLEEPKLKPALWRAICSRIKPKDPQNG